MSSPVKICINGVHYNIATTEPETYLQSIAKELDDQVSAIGSKNPNMSFNDIAVLCAINYVDAYRRSEENADRMRSQLSQYLEDAAKARIELDEARQEVERLKKQLAAKESK